MSKVIRISNETYIRLERLLLPRESFGKLLIRLLDVYRTRSKASDRPGASRYLTKDTWPGKED